MVAHYANAFRRNSNLYQVLVCYSTDVLEGNMGIYFHVVLSGAERVFNINAAEHSGDRRLEQERTTE